MAVAVLIMAQQRMPINGYDNGVKQQQERELLNPVFHDFLGMKYSDSQAVLGAKTASFRNSEASPSASVSLGASSGGGRGPISTTSDLGSGESLLYFINCFLVEMGSSNFEAIIY